MKQEKKKAGPDREGRDARSRDGREVRSREVRGRDVRGRDSRDARTRQTGRRRKKRRKPNIPLQILGIVVCACLIFGAAAGIVKMRSAAKKTAQEPRKTEQSTEAGREAAPPGTQEHAAVQEAAHSTGAGQRTVSSRAEAPPPPPAKWGSPMERYYVDPDFFEGCPKRDVQLLTPNEYSRPQIGLEKVNDIVVHYVDEPGSTAQQNRDYFESLKDGSGRSVSSHFVISLDGSVIQCVPLGEVAYASNHRNSDTISIECCHPDDTGKFTDDTYESCVNLAAWLCYAFEITPDHVIRHYDVNEKYCPIYYVEHPDAWTEMKADIAAQYDRYIAKYGKRA